MVVLPSVNNPVIHLRIKSAIEVSPTKSHCRSRGVATIPCPSIQNVMHTIYYTNPSGKHGSLTKLFDTSKHLKGRWGPRVGHFFSEFKQDSSKDALGKTDKRLD